MVINEDRPLPWEAVNALARDVRSLSSKAPKLFDDIMTAAHDRYAMEQEEELSWGSSSEAKAVRDRDWLEQAPGGDVKFRPAGSPGKHQRRHLRIRKNDL